MCGDDGASDILSDSRSEHGTGPGNKEDDHLLGFSTLHTDTAVPPSQTLSPCGTSSPLSGISASSTSDPHNSSQKPRIWSLADVATSNSSPGSNLPQNSTLQQGPPRPGQLPSHMGPHALQKLAGSDPFNPAINGFRPWVNGSLNYPVGGPGQSLQGSGQTPTGANTGVSGSSSSASAAGLLRPYALAPRTEVH